jgi:hypothetical protein
MRASLPGNKDPSVGRSPVQILRLAEFRAAQRFLTVMLSWPMALKECGAFNHFASALVLNI